MYSILIRGTGSNWTYYAENDIVWEGTKTAAQEQVVKLLATVTTNNIKVVHNCKLDFAGITINDVTE